MKKEMFKVLQGKRLKECLDLRNMSQAEFCRKVDYSPTSLNEIVKANGKRGVPDYLIDKWSQVLGVDAGFFVAGESIETYEDYKGLNLAKAEWSEKAGFLQYADYKIINMYLIDNKRIESFYIFDKKTKQHFTISAETMDAIKSRISEYIRFIMQSTLKEGDAID